MRKKEEHNKLAEELGRRERSSSSSEEEDEEDNKVLVAGPVITPLSVAYPNASLNKQSTPVPLLWSASGTMAEQW